MTFFSKKLYFLSVRIRRESANVFKNANDTTYSVSTIYRFGFLLLLFSLFALFSQQFPLKKQNQPHNVLWFYRLWYVLVLLYLLCFCIATISLFSFLCHIFTFYCYRLFSWFSVFATYLFSASFFVTQIETESNACKLI